MSDLIICAVPDCSRPGYNDGVCTQHHVEAERAREAYFVRERQIDEWVGPKEIPEGEEEGPIHISAVTASCRDQGGTPYGRTVLAGAVEKIATAANGVRNETLNRCAFLVAGYVAGGEIAADAALLGLQTGARACKLPTREAQSTIRSGWQKGLRRPLTAPAR